MYLIIFFGDFVVFIIIVFFGFLRILNWFFSILIFIKWFFLVVSFWENKLKDFCK